MLYDIDKYNRVQKRFLHPVYSGLNVFSDNINDIKNWHPCFKIKNQWFAITHTVSNNCVIINQNDLQGKYCTGFYKHISYITKCDKPKKLAREISGYIKIDGYVEYFNQYGIKRNDLIYNEFDQQNIFLL